MSGAFLAQVHLHEAGAKAVHSPQQVQQPPVRYDACQDHNFRFWTPTLLRAYCRIMHPKAVHPPQQVQQAPVRSDACTCHASQIITQVAPQELSLLNSALHEQHWTDDVHREVLLKLHLHAAVCLTWNLAHQSSTPSLACLV